MTDPSTYAVAVMGTLVSVRIVAPGPHPDPQAPDEERVQRALAWFQDVEAICSRFEPDSELCRLCAGPGRPVPVSPLLYQAVEYALAVAESSDGAFDPTVGHRMEARGFDRNWRTGRAVRSGGDPSESVSFRDVRLDPAHRTVELARPLMLDLGAVAKGLAIDLAVHELLPLESFMIDAGGDIYVHGRNERGSLWAVGIRHPRVEDEVIETVHVAGVAVCTSGDYERHGREGQPHIVDPRTGSSATDAASVTVVAPSAMAADALATAAFVLGPFRGLRLLEGAGVEGLIFTPVLERFQTPGWARYTRSQDSTSNDSAAAVGQS